MKNKIKICLIGAGRIGYSLELDKKRLKPASHFGMWMSNPSTQLVAIADKKKLRPIYKKKKLNLKFYKNYKIMIKKEKPKIISICTWKDTHYEITNTCIDLGVKVIVLEKPLANNIPQAKKILKKINLTKTNVIVNHRRRFDDDIIKLKSLLEKGIIGDILQVSCFYVYGILTTGTHLIDTIRMLFIDIAGEIDEVTGFKSNNLSFKSKDDNNLDAFLKFKNGLSCAIQSLDMKSYDNFDIYIYGKKGKILISGIGRDILYYKTTDSPEHTDFKELTNVPRKINSSKPRPQFKRLGENAINCLLKKSKPLCNATESYKDMMIIDCIIKSAKNNSKKYKIKF